MEINSILGIGLFYALLEADYIKEEEVRLIQEYENLQNLPRKLKKRKKKEVLIDWSLLQHSKRLIGI